MEPLPPACGRAIQVALADIVANPWRSLPVHLINRPLRSVGFSDASLQAIAFAIHTPDCMTAVVSPALSVDIFENE